jgi:hypothetical protein
MVETSSCSCSVCEEIAFCRTRKGTNLLRRLCHKILYLRDARISQPCSRGYLSSGIRRCIVGWVSPNIVNESSIFIIKGHEVWLDLPNPEYKIRYRCAPVSTGNMFQDLPRLRETADNTERCIQV